MSILMTITAAIAGAVAIWGSVLGCKVTCYGGPRSAVRLSDFSHLVDELNLYTAGVLLTMCDG